MPRRRRFGVTSIDRYQLKAFRVHYMPGIPEDIVRAVASNQTSAFTAGFGLYNRVWREKVVPILEDEHVPQMDYAKYRGFMNEYLSKVVIKGTTSGDEVIRKWTGQGADPTILTRIAEELNMIKVKHEEHGG